MSWFALLLAFTAAAIVFRFGVYALDKVAGVGSRAVVRRGEPASGARACPSRSRAPRVSFADRWARIATGGCVRWK